VSVVAASDEFRAKAEALAEELQFPFESGAALHLVVGERTQLREAGSKTGPVCVDFSALKRKYGVGVRRRPIDLIAKAVGAKQRLNVVDATAGLGQDAFVMALYGCEVRMLERSPIVYALLRDGLERAKADPDIAGVSSKLSLKLADAKTELLTLSEAQRPEVVYLDPMYPESGKSAAKRKEMRLFREVVGADTDVQELFKVGLETATKRVVIKRPIKAPELAKPNFVLRGTTTRFDVYVPKS
jgi:16S rRNA (guanine1516-N2)-methyltransferase